MAPLSFIIALLTAVAAFASRRIVKGLVSHTERKTPESLEIATVDGRKITIDASQLTREKVAEIVRTAQRSPMHASL